MRVFVIRDRKQPVVNVRFAPNERVSLRRLQRLHDQRVAGYRGGTKGPNSDAQPQAC